MKHQISIRAATYTKLAADLPRNSKGRIRPGALQERVEKLINEALDKKEGK